MTRNCILFEADPTGNSWGKRKKIEGEGSLLDALGLFTPNPL